MTPRVVEVGARPDSFWRVEPHSMKRTVPQPGRGSKTQQINPASFLGRKTILEFLDRLRIVIHTRKLQVVVG